MRGLYKVGMTTRPPSQRARELSSSTGVPVRFEVEYYAEVENPSAVEAMAHSRLDSYRINDAREFFSGPLASMIRAIQAGTEILSCYEGVAAYDCMTEWASSNLESWDVKLALNRIDRGDGAEVSGEKR